jgi:demethylmenaquinone methyltransferase/2-methoxy-6-polyprenyl-1,4-benzoquinol methylase
MTKSDRSVHDSEFVAALFDEMSTTYAVVNVLSSFGFCWRWRRQVAESIRIEASDVVLDAMCGMGELWHYLKPRLAGNGRIEAVDFSSRMCAQARKNVDSFSGTTILVEQSSILAGTRGPDSVDVVVSSFGLKTFTDEQRLELAREIFRLLRPGGRFSLIEISVPPNFFLRLPYLFYLHRVVPWIGRLFLGNPDNYRMLSVYTQGFQHGGRFTQQCRSVGLEAEMKSYFGGCATAVMGTKPKQGGGE